jgi:hypothetical protein
MSSTGEPYLSVVVTARNDDHGGNLLSRMQAFVNGWIGQARRHQVPSELIVVEWNPPPDRPRLCEALHWPEDLGPCQIRFIEVPPELHRRYAHAEALALYQMIAKNVGIRRARGRFVLATNIDILFSSELAAFFAEQRLQPGRMYRIDRHDAMSQVPVDAPVEEQLAYCRTHLIRINTREGTFSVSPDGRPLPGPGDVASTDSGILFGKGWLPVERYTRQEPFRWAGQRAELLLESVPEPVSALLVDLEPGPGTGGEPLDLEVIGYGHQTLARVTVARRSRLRLPFAPPLPARLLFRVHGAGVPTSRDPRVLNFRVFRLEWERLRKGRGAGRASLRPIRRTNRVMGAWLALQHVVDRLAKGGRLVTLTVPVEPRLRRLLKQYIEFNGFVGLARHALPYLARRRSFQATTPPGADIIPKDSGLLPGTGWRPLDDYRGEIFRLASSGAEVIVSPSAPESGELGLQVEPSAEPLRPLDLLLVDSAGQAVARQHLASLKFIRFSVPRAPGHTQVFRLELHPAEAESSEGGPGELKVFWCGWTDAGRAFGPPLSQPWGAGWRWDAAAGAMTACGSAELVVTASAQGVGPLFIDLETAAPTEFEIRDIHGRVLAAFTANGRAVDRLDLPLAAGRTHVLELTASAPFRAYRCDWTEAPRPHAVRPGSVIGDFNVPVFLHTNACGDFTLMAREHWFDLRGYPEFDLFSMNLDSVLCATAHHGGAPEEMLEEPMRIYHIEHGTGSGWTPEGQAKLFERIAAKGLSFVDNEEVLMWTAQMYRLNAPMIFNHQDWGLDGFDLKETVLP